MNKFNKGPVLKCLVERNEWVGNWDHPYKADLNLQIKGVPTIVIIENG
jgi:hypothetical protein